MKRQVQYLTVEDVIAYHDDAIEQAGGAPGILQPEQLEAAVMAPQATYAGQPLFETLADVAAAYAQYLATGHCFVDGNKRTAFTAMLSFLEINGYDLVLDQPDTWIDIIERVAVSEMSREELAEVLASVMGDWGEMERG